MKLTIQQEDLLKALTITSKIASGKTSLPILQNILLRTEDNTLISAATNLDLAITHRSPASVSQHGAITVPARLMSELVVNLPKSLITLELDGTKLKISTAHHSSIVNGQLADDFPELPDTTSAQRLALEPKLFKKAVLQTSLTASHDSTRPVLMGVYCHTYEGKLYFAATDGYRLSERVLEETPETIKAIIPTTALLEVVRVMPDDIATIDMHLSETSVTINLGTTEVTSRLIDGNFPDYRQLIPASTDNHAVLPRDEVIRIVKVAGVFARESGGSIVIRADEKHKEIIIESLASQLGENNTAIEAEVEGEGSVTLNSRYLLDALGSIDSEQITLGFSGKLAPVVLRPVEKMSSYVHIVMPLKS